MTSSNIQQLLPKVPVDMHIGPVFDAERYLALEHKLFKAQPRQIQHLEKSFSPSTLPRTRTRRFIAMARKVACKLDDILRAPFARFASMKTEEGRDSSNAGDQDAKDPPRQDAATPSRVSTSKIVESTKHPQIQTEVSVPSEKVCLSHAKLERDKKFPVIRKGHNSSLNKFHVDISDVTSDVSANDPMKKLCPEVHQKDTKQPSPLVERQAIDAASAERKPGRRVTFREEDSVIYMDGSSKRRRNGFGTRCNAGNGRREGRGMRPTFCGLRLRGRRR